MGTSAKNSGASPTSALVPTWLDAVAPDIDSPPPAQVPSNSQPYQQPPTEPALPNPKEQTLLPAMPPSGEPNRFRTSRLSFNRATRSGSIRNSLGRSVSEYVRSGMGGS